MRAPQVSVTAGAVLALGAVGVLAVLWWKRGAIADAAGAALNPASPDNLAYRGVNGIGAAVTGDDSWNLGGAVWELFNDGPDINAPPPPAMLPATRYTPGEWDYGDTFGYGAP